MLTKRLSLIDDARDWWRFWSVRFLLLAAAVDFGGLLWLLGILPASIRDMVPPWLVEAVKVALFAMALIARVVPQKKLAQIRAKRANP